jgi:hypothetical protein
MQQTSSKWTSGLRLKSQPRASLRDVKGRHSGANGHSLLKDRRGGTLDGLERRGKARGGVLAVYTACTCLRSSVEMVGIFLSGAFCHTRSKMLRMNHQCLFMTRTMTVRKIIMPQLADGSSPMECSALRRAWSQRVRQVRCCERGPNACATQRAGCMPYYTGSVKVSATTCFPTAAGAASSKSPVLLYGSGPRAPASETSPAPEGRPF